MWFDTHCHLDAAEFDADRDAVVARAAAAGVTRLLVPAVSVASFSAVRTLSQRHQQPYALGLHPLHLAAATEADLVALRHAVQDALDDPWLVAIGEIGLDGFVPDADPARQLRFLDAQLRLAREFELPVILHVRRSADPLLGALRRHGVRQGLAHAFNGSLQQARAYLDQGFRLGFGGAAAYAGSQRIRRLAAELPAEALVVETDAPDIPPPWLRSHGRVGRNEPAELPRIAAEVAQLRGVSPAQLAAQTFANALSVLPRLQRQLNAHPHQAAPL